MEPPFFDTASEMSANTKKNSEDEKSANNKLHFSFTPVTNESQILFKHVDLDSFVVICNNLENFKVNEYFNFATSNCYLVPFKQKKSLNFLIDENKSENVHDFNFYESLLGYIDIGNSTSVKIVYKLEKNVMQDLNLCNDFYVSVVKQSVIELFNTRNSTAVSDFCYVKPNISNKKLLHKENLRIHTESWNELCKILNKKIEAFKQKYNITDIFYYIAEHGIRTSVECRESMLKRYLIDDANLIVAQFHIATELMDSAYQACFTNSNDNPNREETSNLQENIINGSAVLFNFQNLKKEANITCYSGKYNLKNFGHFSYKVSNDFKTKFTTTDFKYLEDNMITFRFDESVTHIMSYDPLFKICPQFHEQPLAFSQISGNYGYVSQLNGEIQNQDTRIRHTAPINEQNIQQDDWDFKCNLKESIETKLKKFLNYQTRSDRMQFNQLDSIPSDPEFINLHKNANVHHTLRILAATNDSYIQHLKYLKCKILHSNANCERVCMCMQESPDNRLEYNEKVVINNSNSSSSINRNINNNNTKKNEKFHCLEKINTFSSMRFEIVHSFKTMKAVETWIDGDPKYEKQKKSMFKFLLSKEIVETSKPMLMKGEATTTKLSTEPENNIATRLYIVGAAKHENGHSQLTHFFLQNVIQPLESLINIETKMKIYREQKSLPTVSETLSTFINQQILQFILHGSENCDVKLMNLLLRKEAFHLFDNNDEISFFNEGNNDYNVKTLIAKRKLTLFSLQYSQSGNITLNRYEGINSLSFTVILNLLEKCEIEGVNNSTESEKLKTFVKKLIKSHIIFALRITQLIPSFSPSTPMTLKYFNDDVAALTTIKFLEKRNKAKYVVNKRDTSRSNVSQFYNYITPETLLATLDNPISYQSQLFRSAFGNLIASSGTSEIFSLQVKKEIFTFIVEKVEFWPCFYLINDKEYKFKFFKVKKEKFPSPSTSASISTPAATASTPATISVLKSASVSTQASSSNTILPENTLKRKLPSENSDRKTGILDKYNLPNQKVNGTSTFQNLYKSITFLDMETTDLQFKDITEICLYEVSMSTVLKLRENLREKDFSYNPLVFEEIETASDACKLILVFNTDFEISKEATDLSQINNLSNANFAKISDESCSNIVNFLKSSNQQPTLLVGYNSEQFDLPILNRLFREHSILVPSNLQSLDLYNILKDDVHNIQLINGDFLNVANLKLETLSNALFKHQKNVLPMYADHHSAKNDCVYLLGLLLSLSDKLLDSCCNKINQVRNVPFLPAIPLKMRKLRTKACNEKKKKQTSEHLNSESSTPPTSSIITKNMLNYETTVILNVLETSIQESNNKIISNENELTRTASNIKIGINLINRKILEQHTLESSRTDKEILYDKIVNNILPSSMKTNSRFGKIIINGKEYFTKIPRLMQAITIQGRTENNELYCTITKNHIDLLNNFIKDYCNNPILIVSNATSWKLYRNLHLSNHLQLPENNILILDEIITQILDGDKYLDMNLNFMNKLQSARNCPLSDTEMIELFTLFKKHFTSSLNFTK